MDRIPLGVSRLDDLIGGGAPVGSAVLLVGEPGAGAREFLYTSAAMNGLIDQDPDLFDLHYGDLHPDATPPPEIHYLSFTTGSEFIEREMRFTMSDEVVDSAVESISFRDFSREYFQLSPIPREWYLNETQRLSDLGDSQGNDDVLETLGAYLNANAPGNLVLVDSLTDLVAGTGTEDLDWSDVSILLKGLTKAAHRWDSLVLVLVSGQTLSSTELGRLTDSAGGTLRFRWETGGSQRARTMVVSQFRGVLSRLESEDIVQFETEIHEGGFDISDVRTIR